jgi:asparagine synthase (glutamine-hydrolysing)
VRDPVGTRPLYLHRTRSRIVFASEIRALLADPAVRLDLDPEQLRVLLSLGFNPAPKTLLKGIHKMPPGHLLEVSHLGVHIVPYDRPDEEERDGDVTFDDAVESYRSLLHRVARRIGGERKGGSVLLSGGGDSSGLVWLQTCDKIPVTTFTAGFPEAGSVVDERVHAWQAARALGTMHRERLIELSEIGPLFLAAARIIEEPVASGWAPLMLRLLESVSGQASVVWSGQGAGGLHGEDPFFRWLQWGESVADLPPFVGKVVGGVARRLPTIGGSGSAGSRILTSQEERDRVLGSFLLFDDPSLDRLLRAGHIGDAEGVRRLLDRWREPVLSYDPLAQALYIRARTYLPEAICVPASRLAAEARVGIRFPYADSEIVRFLEGLPPAYRLEGGVGKRLHRDALSAWIPGAVLSSPKRSMTDAVSHWLRGEGRDRAEGWLLGPNAWLPSVLDGVRVRRVIEEAARGRARAEGLVLLIQLELWARETLLGGMH